MIEIAAWEIFIIMILGIVLTVFHFYYRTKLECDFCLKKLPKRDKYRYGDRVACDECVNAVQKISKEVDTVENVDG